MAMAPFSRLLLLALMLIVFSAKIGQSVRVTIYSEANYKGFVEEVILSKERELDCVDFKSSDIITSVKSDKCLIIYRQKGCRSEGPTFNFLEKNIKYTTVSFRIDQDSPRIPERNVFRSFHVCSQKRGGGPQLDLDVFGGFVMGIPFSFRQADEHEYRGVCDCRNFISWVPKIVHFPQFAYINNYGNSVIIYGEEDCQGKSKYVVSGQGPDSWELVYFPFKLRSFKPAGLPHCYRLNLSARIYELRFSNGTTSEDDLDTIKVQLAASANINNNGASEITQTYRVSSKVTNTVEFSVANSLSLVHSAGVEIGAEFKCETGVPVVASAEVTTSIKANYQYTRTEGSDVRNTTTTTTEEGIEIEQQIKIPACKACTVTTFVKRVKGFEIKYKAYAYVSARDDAEPMTADLIRKNLPPGLKYVRDKDKHTVVAVTDGTMSADYGSKSVVDVDCVPIPTCGPTYYSMDDHQIYESPLDVLPANKYKSASEPGPGQTANRSTIFPFLKHSIGLLMKHLS